MSTSLPQRKPVYLIHPDSTQRVSDGIDTAMARGGRNWRGA